MSDCRWAASLFAAAFLARLVALLGSAIFGTDSCHYLLMADWMREGRFHEALSIAYHPLYPLLISAVRTVLPTTEQAGYAVSLLLGAGATVPLFLAVRAVFGRPCAVLTALLYAFSPAIVEVQSDVMTEGAFLFFLFSSLWLTWRLMEQPSLERGAVLGAAAAGAFLTRPEGILAIVLAVSWPLIELGRTRAGIRMRAGATVLTLVVVVLLLAPYLLWVKSERGHWALSVRPAAISAEKAAGIDDGAEGDSPGSGQARLYRIYGVSLFRLSLYGVLIPFYALGIRALRGVPGRALLFYLSYPSGLLGGVLLTLRTHNFMSERYLLGGVALLAAIASLGMVEALRLFLRAAPASRLRPIAALAVILLLAVAPVLKSLKLRRQELMSYPLAGRWILDHGPQPKAVIGLEQVAYYSGSRSYYAPQEKQPFLDLLDHQPTDYVVYSEKDLRGRPAYVAMLRSLDRLEPAAEVKGLPGTWTVYILRVK